MAEISKRRKWQLDILERMNLTVQRTASNRPVSRVEQAAVLRVIDRYAREDGWYFRSQEALAKECFLSKRTLERTIEVLKRLGYVDRQPFGHGRGNGCRWRVIHQELARQCGLPLWDQPPDLHDQPPDLHDQPPDLHDQPPDLHDQPPMRADQELFNSKNSKKNSSSSSSSSSNGATAPGEEVEEGALCTKWNSVAIAEQPASAWDRAIAKLRDTGLRATDYVVAEARCRRISPEVLIRAIEFYQSRRGAWLRDGVANPGVITFWVRQARDGDEPTDLRLWPTQNASYVREQARSLVRDDQAAATRAVILAGRAAQQSDEQIRATLQAAGLEWPR